MNQAVVVGVQKYPRLPARANQLRGCVNDAREIAKTLTTCNFKVALLTDAQAGKAAILAAIGAAGKELTSADRFVFYFAGHGTNRPKAGLLPADTQDGVAESYLDKEELYNALVALPATSRTVILDACFSGGMTKAVLKPTARRRFYAPTGAKGGSDPVVNQDQPPIPPTGDASAICYYTAALANEEAREDEFKGVYHGVFTHYLLPELAQHAKKGALWKEMHKKVKTQVVFEEGDLQHPTLSRAYLTVPIFQPLAGAIATPSPKPTGGTLWDVYIADAADSGAVSLALLPNQTQFAVNERFTLSATVGRAGYLVVIERFTDNKLYLVFPESKSVKDANVKPGQAFSHLLRGNAPGTERLKAILFTTKEKADAVLKLFRDRRGEEGIPLSGAQGAKNLEHLKVPDAPFYTSEMTFEIV